MKVVIEEIAYADVDDIAAFYEKQRKGTASYFVRRFSECVLALQTTGGTHRKRQDYHFCMVKNFPSVSFTKWMTASCAFVASWIVAEAHAGFDPNLETAN